MFTSKEASELLGVEGRRGDGTPLPILFAVTDSDDQSLLRDRAALGRFIAARRDHWVGGQQETGRCGSGRG